jgi:hypothetical protein
MVMISYGIDNFIKKTKEKSKTLKQEKKEKFDLEWELLVKEQQKQVDELFKNNSI